MLHVQSISRWAPSCIGPYSQATTLGALLQMAGQIGLDPPTMQLVSGGFKHQLIRYTNQAECRVVPCSSVVEFCPQVLQQLAEISYVLVTLEKLL